MITLNDADHFAGLGRGGSACVSAQGDPRGDEGIFLRELPPHRLLGGRHDPQRVPYGYHAPRNQQVRVLLCVNVCVGAYETEREMAGGSWEEGEGGREGWRGVMMACWRVYERYIECLVNIIMHRSLVCVDWPVSTLPLPCAVLQNDDPYFL